MEKYLTWHPLGKSGTFISEKDYETIRDFIVSTLMKREMTLAELIGIGELRLAGQIKENIGWGILVVKLDLEARGIIISVLKVAPYKLHYLKVRKRLLKRMGTYQSAFRSVKQFIRKG